jgi:3-hydroxy-9,10-secoandrosta-1,3,5(10)-triene-9,17-dione monooxygenase
MPGNVRPTAEAVPVDGGYRVTGAWDYVSGCDSATHFVIGAEVSGNGDGPPQLITGIADAGDCGIVDNWDVHGLRGTGSKRVVAEDVFVPAYRTLGSLFGADLRAAPGRDVHPNPFYRAGGIFSLLFSEITAVAIGTARGVLDLYEATLPTRKTTTLPIVTMSENPDYHRFYGEALQLIDVAEGALLASDRDYMEWSRRDIEDGVPFAIDLELRLGLRKQLCSKLASDAVDLMVRTGGSSALKNGTQMDRYRRDMTMMMTHNTTQQEQAAGGYGRFRYQQWPFTVPPPFAMQTPQSPAV